MWPEGKLPAGGIQEADAVKINMKLISLTRPWIAENSTGFRWAAEPNCEAETMLGVQLIYFSALRLVSRDPFRLNSIKKTRICS